ncbi:MAG TPA: IS1182 family transposase [Acidiferrobacteraceae bacterium]|nr:IS1182 family transposase [Acidiferrobacteraceae bacterium]
MRIPFKTSPAEFDQHLLFPSNVFNLLPKDHECFLYTDLFGQLDTSVLESQYSAIGQRAYHPKLIVSILIYAYSRGVFSSRQIEQRCNEDLSFMYIAQMNCPNFRVLSDFRKDHPKFFQDCFKQTVRLAMELKLATLGHISLDGSKFKANSSRHKAMSYNRLKEKEQQLTKEIADLVEQARRCDEEEDLAYKNQTGYEIPEDLQYKTARLERIKEAKEALEKREQDLYPGKTIADKKQISFADHDARIMGKKGDFDYRYNGQISVDQDHQMIVGQHLSQKANDQQEMGLALESLQNTTGRLPEKMSADNGYLSGDNLEALGNTPIDSYLATGRGEKTSKTALGESNRTLVKADFVYQETEDCFFCPGGQVLGLKRQTKEGTKTYQGNATVCADCCYKDRCWQSSKGEARTITTDDKEGLRQQMRDKMEAASSKAIYKKRKEIVEPVFGQVKNGGFRGFSVRGKAKVAGEFALVCATHNLKKIARCIRNGSIRLEFGKWEILST